MIAVLDERQARRDLAGSTLRSPVCGGPLRRWGFARVRRLRLRRGGQLQLRPRRTRCVACGVTHVLLPAAVPARHAYTLEVVGPALLASAQGGRSCRAIGAELALPADTVRGWVRRATGQTERLRTLGTAAAHAYDPLLPPIEPTGRSALADARSALAVAAAAVVRLLGPIAPVWHLIAMVARGQLLAPLRSDWSSCTSRRSPARPTATT